MLILTRKKGQRIWIGDDVVVTVIEIRGKQIKIGIAAPADVKIMREEKLNDAESVQPTVNP